MTDGTGYCTHEDVRRALQETDIAFDDAELSGEYVTDAITAQTDWVDETIKRHWYDPDGLEEDTEGLIPSEPRTREDEEDIKTRSAFVVDDDGPEPKPSHATYTRIRLARRDVGDIRSLYVLNGDGEYVDWVEDNDIESGRFGDYYVQVNNEGWSELYLDIDQLDDLDSYSRAVYVEYDYGHEGLPKTLRRGIALRAGADLIRDDESAVGIPDSGQLVELDTKADAMESRAEEYLDTYR